MLFYGTLSLSSEAVKWKYLGLVRGGMGDSRRVGLPERSALIAFDGGCAERSSRKSFYCLVAGVSSHVLIFKQQGFNPENNKPMFIALLFVVITLGRCLNSIRRYL